MNNDWIEHKMYVLNNLNELKYDTKTIKNELSTLKYTFTVFQTKVISSINRVKKTMADGQPRQLSVFLAVMNFIMALFFLMLMFNSGI